MKNLFVFTTILLLLIVSACTKDTANPYYVGTYIGTSEMIFYPSDLTDSDLIVISKSSSTNGIMITETVHSDTLYATIKKENTEVDSIILYNGSVEWGSGIVNKNQLAITLNTYSISRLGDTLPFQRIIRAAKQ